MGEVNWTPDEFARLMALPREHPDRVVAEADPAFEAWVRMAGAFETGAGAQLDEDELRRRGAALTTRLERALASERETAEPVRGAPSTLRSGRRGSLVEKLLGWLGTPSGRTALAFGVIAIASVAGWWTVARRDSQEMVRGVESGSSVPRLAEPVTDAGTVVLAWSAVPGADGYRLVFYSPEMGELARLDSLREPRATLRSGALPAGLAGGARVELEVVALTHGDPLSRSRLVPITLP
jgi:hypothetical protein